MKEFGKLVLKEEKVTYTIRDEEVEVTEKYYINSETNERVYNREVAIENDIIAYDEYKKKKGLLTTKEIKEIRRKYDLTQKEYALAIGVGEITVHRFENGTIQTESIDSIMRLSKNTINMYELLNQNREKLEKEVYERTEDLLKELIALENHKIADINISNLLKYSAKTEELNKVTDAIIREYNDIILIKEKKNDIEMPKITPLELQKYLYYVQGITLAVYGIPAFENEIKAWSYGPVVEEIYHKYKENKGKEIREYKEINISKGIKEIVKKVVSSYGKYTAYQLIDLTHEEEPWKTTNHDGVIDKNLIRTYFERVYGINREDFYMQRMKRAIKDLDIGKGKNTN